MSIHDDESTCEPDSCSHQHQQQQQHDYQPCSVVETLPGDKEEDGTLLPPHKGFLQEQIQSRRTRLVLLILALITVIMGGNLWRLYQNTIDTSIVRSRNQPDYSNHEISNPETTTATEYDTEEINSALRGSASTPQLDEEPSASEVLGKVTFNDGTLGTEKGSENEAENTVDGDKNELTPTKESERKDFIDFAVAGFEKCGTTFLLKKIFNQSPQIFMAGGDEKTELHDLSSNELDELYQTFEPHLKITSTKDGVPKLMGFKNPLLLATTEWVQNMQDNFPKTKLIFTLRHPVLWFQSWYNYKLRSGFRMPRPEDTVGLCNSACDHKGPEGKCAKGDTAPGCSGHSNFHQYLSRLGLTPRDTEEELRLLEHTQMPVFSFPETQVFLTEIGQMDGTNMTVSKGLIREMEGFLGLEENALPDIQPHKQRNYTYSDETLSGMIDICDDKYVGIRAHLLDKGRKAGEWIEEYFLKSMQVHVHDRRDFLHRIRHWKVNPCLS